MWVPKKKSLTFFEWSQKASINDSDVSSHVDKHLVSRGFISAGEIGIHGPIEWRNHCGIGICTIIDLKSKIYPWASSLSGICVFQNVFLALENNKNSP